MKNLLCALLVVGPLALAQSQELVSMPVHDVPKWKVITGLPEAPNAAVAVSSLQTNTVIGQVKPNEKVLVFGSDGRVATFAFNGTIGYIPVTAVRDLYVVVKRVPEYRAWGPTLEEVAEAERLAETNPGDRSLAPLPKTQPANSGAAGGAGGAPAGALSAGGRPGPGGAGGRGGEI